LLDKEVVEKAYAVAGMKEAGKSIGVGLIMFQKALKYHKIPVRRPGTSPPCVVNSSSTKAVIPKKVLKRMKVLKRHLDDPDAGCPPRCPGVDTCMSKDGECILREIVERMYDDFTVRT
jgi:hypothetical protein